MVVAATEHRGHRHAADRLPALRAVVAAEPQDPPPGGVPWTDRTGADGAARILVSSGSEAEPKIIAYSHNALAVAPVVPLRRDGHARDQNASAAGVILSRGAGSSGG
ncbi:hypothetical protein GCM10009678_14900 [Actinomadura kijaniata]|uniref:Acyl-coenzyme A synthetase/AMP-(Fatty) acid ligase n=1 Tax=Actinomadura namibiensis TaxID=182080 RepID=A0A7W3LQY5_ACTNM|nr:acyl-coenzyme A synthetase/AMP-(fatty) acid ligase [Actinomadura namibiensis]